MALCDSLLRSLRHRSWALALLVPILSAPAAAQTVVSPADAANGAVAEVPASPALMDPIIEEPLRPLYPQDQPLSPAVVSGACGQVGAMFWPVTWLLAGAMGVARRREFVGLAPTPSEKVAEHARP